MTRAVILYSKVLLLIFLLIGCVPVPIPYSSKPISNIDSQSLGFPSINRGEIDLLVEQAADRKKMITKLGRPIRYRAEDMSYNVCYHKGGLAVLFIVPMMPYGGDMNVAGGDIECYELMLIFNEQNILSQVIEKQEALKVDDDTEDLNLSKFGLLGDPIAQSLWLESKTYMLQALEENASEVDAKALMKLYWRLHLTDTQAAHRLLCRAADQGITDACYQLGVSYRYGINGLPIDRPKSYLWYSLAAQYGYRRAEFNRQDLLSEMVSSQLEEGQALLNAWQPGQCEREIFESKPYEYDQLVLKYNEAVGELWKDIALSDPVRNVIELWRMPVSVAKSTKEWNRYKTIGNTTEGLTSLCRAADMGNPYAQMKLGRIYFGLNDIKDNRSKSYLWYMFATLANEPYGLDGEMPVQWRALNEVVYKKKSVLTNYQLLKVEELLSLWEPGQCEREVVSKGLGNDQ